VFGYVRQISDVVANQIRFGGYVGPEILVFDWVASREYVNLDYST